MSTTRINPKRQITIPKSIFDEINLEIGDVLDAHVHNGKIILTPQHKVDFSPVLNFTSAEQKILHRAQAKIDRINSDLLHSKGLTPQEIELAAMAGLIAKDQSYFWTEEWQKNERAAELDIQEGRVSGPFETADVLIEDLHRRSQEA